MSFYDEIKKTAQAVLPPDVWTLVSEKKDLTVSDIDDLLRSGKLKSSRQRSALAALVADDVIRFGKELGLRRQFFTARVKEGVTIARLGSLGLISEERLIAIQSGDFDRLNVVEKRFLKDYFGVTPSEDGSLLLKSWEGTGMLLQLSSMADFDNSQSLWDYALKHCEHHFENGDIPGMCGAVIRCEPWEAGLTYPGVTFIEVDEMPVENEADGVYLCRIGAVHSIVTCRKGLWINSSGDVVDSDTIAWALPVKQVNTKIIVKEEDI